MNSVKIWIESFLEDDLHYRAIKYENLSMQLLRKLVKYKFNNHKEFIDITDAFAKAQYNYTYTVDSIHKGEEILAQIEMLDNIDQIINLNMYKEPEFTEDNVQYLGYAKNLLNETLNAANRIADTDKAEFEHLETLFQQISPLTSSLKTFQDEKTVHDFINALNSFNIDLVTRLIEVNKRLNRYNFDLAYDNFRILSFASKNHKSTDDYSVVNKGETLEFFAEMGTGSLHIVVDARSIKNKYLYLRYDNAILRIIGTIGFLQENIGKMKEEEISFAISELKKTELVTLVECSAIK